MSSFMRLMQRRTVLLPQPDGPMMAVICLSWNGILTFSTAWNAPYHRFRFCSWIAIGALDNPGAAAVGGASVTIAHSSEPDRAGRPRWHSWSARQTGAR